VPGGGLSPDGSKWIACRPRYFLTVEVLSALFRRLFLERLVAAHDAGQLQFFGDHVRLADKAAFEAYLTPLHAIDWVVYAKEPFAGPEQVLRYLSRYTHRVAISNRRLVSVDEKGVTFKYKDYRIEGPGRYAAARARTRQHGRLVDLCGVADVGLFRRHREQLASVRNVCGSGAVCEQPIVSDAMEALGHDMHQEAPDELVGRQRHRPHDHHRDLRARLCAQAPTNTRGGGDQDRHLMMPSPPIRHQSDTRYSRRLSTGIASACLGPSNRPATTAPFRSTNLRSARSTLQQHPRLHAKPSPQRLRLIRSEPETVLKPP
jgi:hypothetical protein